MTDILRLQTLRYALHTNASTFTGTPGSLFPLQITDDGASFLPRQRTPIERPLKSLGGRRYPHIRGAQDTADVSVVLEMKGVNSNTGAAVATWETKLEQGYLLQSLFGTAAPATTGAAPTIAAAGHTPSTGVVAFTAAANVQNGAVIAFATSSGLQIGRVETGGGATTTSVTLQHPYSGTPTNAATVYRLAVYDVSDSVTGHIHAFFAAEGEDWRRDYFGCAPMSMNIAVPNTGLVTMSSTFSPTTWSDVAEANPAYADPTAGNPLVNDGAIFRLDGVEFLLRNASITYNCATAMRETSSRTNGKLGGVCGTGDGKSFMIEGELYLGDASTVLPEAIDNGSYAAGAPQLVSMLGSDVAAGQISTAREVSLQIGTEIGGCMYALLPSADFRATMQAGGAFPVVKFQAMGTGALPATLAVG
jgi:hypothetical protein